MTDMTIPYFMDYGMIEAVMRDQNCSREKAREVLTELWKERPND